MAGRYHKLAVFVSAAVIRIFLHKFSAKFVCLSVVLQERYRSSSSSSQMCLSPFVKHYQWRLCWLERFVNCDAIHNVLSCCLFHSDYTFLLLQKSKSFFFYQNPFWQICLLVITEHFDANKIQMRNIKLSSHPSRRIRYQNLPVAYFESRLCTVKYLKRKIISSINQIQF